MSCNFASILQYGGPKLAVDAYDFALHWTSGLDLGSTIQEKDEPTDPSVHLPPMAFQGSALAFHTLSVLLDLMLAYLLL
jgi:hypothetical protein